MTKSEISILRSVFGYQHGPVRIPGYVRPLHQSMKRLLDAARALEREGLVCVRPDKEKRGVFNVSPAFDPFDEPVCDKYATAGVEYSPR